MQYYNHSNLPVVVRIPRERYGVLGIEVEPLGHAEIPLQPNVVAQKAPQLKTYPPGDPTAYDNAAKVEARSARIKRYVDMSEADLERVCDLVGLDVITQMKLITDEQQEKHKREMTAAGTANKRFKKPTTVHQDLAEVVVRFEENSPEGRTLVNKALSSLVGA